MSKVKLFCLPYSGASAQFYLQWTQFLEKNIELIPVELPGRGKRKKEALLTNFQLLVEDVFNNIQDNLENDYALLGHSMGSLIVFELTQRIISNNKRKPLHLFLSGCCPPHILANTWEKIGSVSDNELAKQIYKLGGIPKEVYEHERLLKKIINVIRHDYLCIGSYNYRQTYKTLNCDLTVLGGTKDSEACYKNLLQWKKYTKGKFSINILNGNHFFIFDNLDTITTIIKNKLYSIST